VGKSEDDVCADMAPVPPAPTSGVHRTTRTGRGEGPRTINLRRQTKRERVFLRLVSPPFDHWRPSTRNECVDGPRPCPYVGCQPHLYLDVSERTGNLRHNWPRLEPDELAESCALDVAENGPSHLGRIAELLNITKERVRQLEDRALRRLLRLARAMRVSGDV